jgi:glycosyltransferase involved in cell wall biosynthesis
MKILGVFFNNEIRTGGHRRYLELIEGLARRGNDVLVLLNEALEWRPSAARALRLPVRYTRGKDRFIGSLYLNALRSARIGKRELGEREWVVVFGETHWKSALFLQEACGPRIAFAFRSDRIEAGMAFLRYDRGTPLDVAKTVADIAVTRVRERRIARKADLLFFQSAHDRDAFAARNPRCLGRTRVIPGDIMQPRFEERFENANASSSCRRLLYVGTLGVRKGLRYLLSALQSLPADALAGVSLAIVAVGKDYPKFEPAIRQLRERMRVDFHGRVDSVFPLMVESDLLVLPSLFDSYPNSVLEALHVGLPVIASSVGGIPEMLGDDALLFRPGDAASLAGSLRSMITDTGAYERARKLCAARREAFRFDWAGRFDEALRDATNDAIQGGFGNEA